MKERNRVPTGITRPNSERVEGEGGRRHARTIRAIADDVALSKNVPDVRKGGGESTDSASMNRRHGSQEQSPVEEPAASIY